MRSSFSVARAIAKTGLFLILSLALFGLTACSATYRNHGYVPTPEDLEQIVVGIDTRSTVEETLGSAGSTSVREDNALYFVRSRVRTFAMLEPEVIERKIVAVSFDGNGVVQNVETFGLERGQVVRLTRRVTDSSVATGSVFSRIANNIGSFGPTGLDGL